MKEIKFRGVDIDSGKWRYGCFIVGRCGQPCIATNFTAAYEVDPESVAQFVGYDKHGREVYEGDILYMDNNGVHYEYKAHLGGYATAENGCYITAKQFADKELKVSA